MRIAEMTWMQVETYLERDDRCVIPLGSVEQHAYLSLAVDAILSERVAVDAAEPLGVPVFPAMAYGITPYFMAYPGTVTLTPKTYQRVVGEILDSVHAHGFRRIAVVNGHGGNRVARASVERWADKHDGTTVVWHDWWNAPATMAAVKEIDDAASHASWMEGFAWTQVDGVQPPVGHKASVDLSGRDEMSAEEFREVLGDGSFGGYYTRPDGDLRRVWSVAVEETRALLVEGWS
ncbi:MAG: creatininase family protein [Longimicrobiales bacterium]